MGPRGLIPIVVLANVSATMTFGVVSVVIAEITRQFGVPVSHGIWVPDAFLVAVVCVTPLSAWLVRRFDARRLLLVALTGLSLAAVAAAAAPTLPLLTALIFLHGLFAAPIAPLTQHLVASRLPPEARGRGMAWWTGGTLGGGLLGGTVGGPVAEFWHTAPALGLVIPVAALTAVVVLREPAALARASGDAAAAAPAADLAGAGLLIVATLSLGLVLNIGDNVNWFAHPATFVLIGMFLVAAFGFARHYRRVAEPVINLAPLREPRFAAAALIILGVNAVSTGQFETGMLGAVLGFDAEFLSLRAGLGGLALLVGVALAAGLLVRFSPLPLLALAFAFLLAGKAGYLAYGGPVGWFAGLWPALVSSLGFGMLASLLAAYAFDRVDAALTAAATACFVFAGQVGAALGLAGLDLVMSIADHIHTIETAAGGRLAFLLVFGLELAGTALLCLLLPAFRQAGNSRAPVA